MDNQMFATAFMGLAHLYYAVHDLDIPVLQIPGPISDKENTDPAEEVSLYFEALQHAGPNGNGVSISEVALAMRTRSVTSDEPVFPVALPETNIEGPEEVSPLLEDSPFLAVENQTDPLALSLVAAAEGLSKRRKRADSTSEDDHRPSKTVKAKSIAVDPIQRKEVDKSELCCGPSAQSPKALRSKSMKKALKRL